jgi:hypothetical protein
MPRIILPADANTPDALDLFVSNRGQSSVARHRKSEAGGVQLGVTSLEGIAGAIHAIRNNVKKIRPDATVEGFTVAEMITDGLETLIGVVRDPSFGPVVAFGLGGIATEVLKDITYRVAPFGVDQARAMIAELRAAPLFDAFRSRGALDVNALAEAIARVSILAAQEERIRRLISIRCSCPRGNGVTGDADRHTRLTKLARRRMRKASGSIADPVRLGDISDRASSLSICSRGTLQVIKRYASGDRHQALRRSLNG